MEKFLWYNPTKLYFGKNQIEKLAVELKNYHKVLLVYGGGSIKSSGLYDQVAGILKAAAVPYFELPGVEPNPKITSVREGIELVKENGIDLLLAIGGGSVIDCAKAIGVGALSDADILDILMNKVKADKGMDIGTILTLSATGSEMNPRVVISDADLNLKLGIGTWDNDATFPTFSICDPAYTLTVPLNQTVNGIVDIISHTFEQYFNKNTNSIMGDAIAESLVKTMMETGPKLLKDLQNYELRETMMICATMAWNGLLRGLTNNGDWACHQMEHALSAVYDIPHGEGLAIVTPVWMEYCAAKDPSKFAQMAKNIFNVSGENKTEAQLSQAGIDAFRSFLKILGTKQSMADYGIKDYDLDSLVDKTMLNRPFIGGYVKLKAEDVKNILNKIF